MDMTAKTADITKANKVFTDISGMENDEDILKAYAIMAPNFEDFTTAYGYTGHVHTAMTVSEVEPNRNARILDVGCGTGLVGDQLCTAGYHNIYGVDMSEELINAAQEKKTYVNLVRAKFEPNNPLKFTDGYFDLALSSGCFLPNHLNETHIPEMVRLVKPGGYVIVSTRKKYFEEEEGDMKLKSGLADFVKNGLIERVSHDDFLYGEETMGITLTYRVV